MSAPGQGPGFGIVLIGDELLSGKRRDKHMPKVIEILAARGLELDWARMVGDDAARLEATLAQTLAGADVVFCFGGIGPTPDDRTRQCAARAAGVPLEINREGRAVLMARFGERAATRNRISMVEWPAGAAMIPNPVNQVPGFSFGQHHFVPGFPNMAWPMVEWVLDTHYGHLHSAEHVVEYLLEARDTPESEVVDTMQAVMDAHPGVRIGCLPNAGGRRALEFGIRGASAQAAAAYEHLYGALQARDVPLHKIDAPDS